MHLGLYLWREELPSTVLRLTACLGGIAILSMGAGQFLASAPAIQALPNAKPAWVEIERQFPAFALAIPEADDAPSSYVIRRHATGGGRKDVLTLAETNGVSLYLHVEIYGPGSEISGFADAKSEIVSAAAALRPVKVWHSDEPAQSKFGPLSIVVFETSLGTPRRCLGFLRYDDPLLQLSGWFCQGGLDFIERSTLACALDRLTLLSAGSERKVGALFAQAELNRSFCGQRDPILASTPKYTLLWKALEARAAARRIAR